jgi:hypothetical protein
MGENQMKAITDQVVSGSFGLVSLTAEEVVTIHVNGVAAWAVGMDTSINGKVEFVAEHQSEVGRT